MRRACTVGMVCAVVAGEAHAQVGRIAGTIRGPDGQPLTSATVLLAGLAASAQTQDSGTFVIGNVPPGEYHLKVLRLGYRSGLASGVVVRAGEVTRANLTLERAPVQLDAMVVSVSRRAESVTDAPAAVTKFDVDVISDGLGDPVTRLLKQAPGVELTQVGVLSSFVNGRGFNRVFNSRWLTLEDGRVAAFAETGLPVGENTTVAKIDVAGYEVIAGPGSALYGANASGGVLSVQTKDPRRYPGLAVELSGGTRELQDAQLRYAATSGKWGYKLVGQHQSARDWTDTVFYPSAAGALREAARHFGTRVDRFSGSARYYMNDASHIELNAGASSRDGLGQTSQGRYAIEGYRYQKYQVLFHSTRWMVQAYGTTSNSGDTYRLNIYTAARASFPSLTDDSVRSIAAFPVAGRILAVEAQNNGMIGEGIHTGLLLLDNTHYTVGAQARRDHINSFGRLYSDVRTGKPIEFEQEAAYGQVESDLSPTLRFVGAARVDMHSRFGTRWSPKAGLVYDIAPDQVLRATYNVAYLSPTILQSDVYALNAAAKLVTIGNSHGFTVRDSAGALLNTVSPLGPETNQTWELGYKGVVGRRLYVDATLYRSVYRDFMQLAGPIADPFAATQTFAFDSKTGARVNDLNGAAVATYTFINVGQGTSDGLDAALRYYLTNHLALASTTSLQRVGNIKTKPTDPPEAAAFSSSPQRSTLALELADLPANAQITLRGRYVQSYEFRSGSDWGQIPTYGTLSVNATYRLAGSRATILVQADNIVTCVSGTTTPPPVGISALSRAMYTARRTCGLGVRHHEILNMPAVGTMVMLGVRYERN